MSTILVVDDEAGIRELLREILEDEGHEVKLAENAARAAALRTLGRPDLVLLDIWMPDTDGITLLKDWKGQGLLTMPVVMMSGHGTIDTAVEATKIGAFDFLEKPIALQKLLKTVGGALKRGEAQHHAGLDLAGLGKGPSITALKHRLSQIARVKTPVLLLGEKGCGTELCARFLHEANTPWVVLEDTATLTEKPLEVAAQARDGLLFVPEIAHLSKFEQKGLLLLLNRIEKFNIRLVCASSQPLMDLSGRQFDPNLLNALSGLVLTVPSLREHREDVPELARAFLAQYVEAREAPSRHFTVAALNALRNADWPGNLPQLDNAVKSLGLTSLDEEITAEDVSRVLSELGASSACRNSSTSIPMDAPLRDARDAFEREYFEYHIAKAAGNMSRVSEQVGMERTHLYRKLKQLGIKFARKVE